jgi:hypothetical protein
MVTFRISTFAVLIAGKLIFYLDKKPKTSFGCISQKG